MDANKEKAKEKDFPYYTVRFSSIENHKCCFCGKDYNGYGNSTWGCWSPIEEKAFKGEKMRCCDECNMIIVVPTRMEITDK